MTCSATLPPVAGSTPLPSAPQCNPPLAQAMRSGAWDWKTAYEAVEVAQLLFMRRYGPAIHARTADPFERLKLVERIARLAPTQTRRSEEMQAYQQFSTPLGLAWVAGFAAGLHSGRTGARTLGGHRPARHSGRTCRNAGWR
jgi:hypothetical protein